MGKSIAFALVISLLSGCAPDVVRLEPTGEMLTISAGVEYCSDKANENDAVYREMCYGQ